MTVLSLTLLAHVLSDFIFQTTNMVKMKSNKSNINNMIKAQLRHGVIVFITLIAMLHTYYISDVIIYSLCISIVHIGMDFLKTFIEDDNNKIFDIISFIIDQIIHIIVILIFWKVFNLRANYKLINAYVGFFQTKEVPVLEFNNVLVSGVPYWKIVISIAIYIYICIGGSVLMSKALNIMCQNKLKQVNTTIGACIGILERLLVITMVASNELESIGFILAAKSVARFQELDNKLFAEYYIAGTLLSTTLGVLGGYIIKFIIY